MISNSEDFSAQLGEIAFYGSIDYPPKDDKWTYLGTLYPELSSLEGHEGEHLLSLGSSMDEPVLTSARAMTAEESLSSQSSQMLVRYLKVDMRGSERNDNGLYCTITRVKVFGSSMHQVIRGISMDLFQSANGATDTSSSLAPVVEYPPMNLEMY